MRRDAMSVVVYSLENGVFRTFLFYGLLSLLKLLFMSLLTSAQRFMKNAFANPEDIPRGVRHLIRPTLSDPDVERVRRNHLNDLENILPFVLIGLSYVAVQPSPPLAFWHFRLFFASRLVHTIVYQFALRQPLRALSFLLGYALMISMVVQTLVKLV